MKKISFILVLLSALLCFSMPAFAAKTEAAVIGDNYQKVNVLDTATQLSAPVIGSVSNVYGGVKITWGKVTDAAKYRVFRKTGSSGWKKLTDTASLSFTDTAAVSGTKYTYTVRCLDSEGSYVSASASGKTITYYQAPVLGSISNVNGGVKLTWESVAGIAKYRVYRKTEGTSWKKVGETTATNYTDNTAVSGTKYTYTVRCMDSSGNMVSAHDSTGLMITYVAAPAISTSVVNGGIKITWDKVTGASKYRVFRKTGSGGWKTLADVTSGSYTDKTVESGSTYKYTVRCLDSEGNYLSDSASYKTASYYSAPVLGTISNVYGGVKITWEGMSGVAKYRVFRKTEGTSWKKVGDTTSTSYTDKTAASGTEYTYTVRCLDASGNYTSMHDSTGKTIKYIAAPVISSVGYVNDGVKISWGKVTGASKYRVYRKKSGGGWEKVCDTTSTSCIDTPIDKFDEVPEAIDYYYTVKCIDNNGNGISSFYSTGKKAPSVIVKSGYSFQRYKKATISIKDAANTTYSIKVIYSSGVSEAQGLYAKKSDASGNISWTWTIGSKTSIDKHYAVIIGNGKKFVVYFNVTQ